VVVSNIVSIDGFFEGPGGDVMALNVDAAFDAYDLERIRAELPPERWPSPAPTRCGPGTPMPAS
jgi:hypothetical protein